MDMLEESAVDLRLSIIEERLRKLEEAAHPTATELRRMPSDKRDAILRAAADKAVETGLYADKDASEYRVWTDRGPMRISATSQEEAEAMVRHDGHEIRPAPSELRTLKEYLDDLDSTVGKTGDTLGLDNIAAFYAGAQSVLLLLGAGVTLHEIDAEIGTFTAKQPT